MKESKAEREASIDEFGELGDDIGKFLQKNYGLIIQKAKKKFGVIINVPEVLSDAAEAWHAMKDYHSKSQFTKHTTTYSWFLNRQLDISYRFGVTVDSGHIGRYSETADGSAASDTNEFILDQASHRTYFSGHDEGGLDHEERLFYLSEEIEDGYNNFSVVDGEDDGSGRKARNDSLSYVPRYVICMESFNKCSVSGELRLLLKSLSEKNTSLNLGRYKKLLATRRSMSAVSDRLRQHLLYETAKAGYDLYIGICSNGSCNNVLVAARSQDEATKYLTRYGKLIDLRHMDITQFSRDPD